ncbi:retinoblastoma-like protein 1 [Gouania willdenowi]|uniref:retinoblastoma-like protein 1 n=1 Tax=Gouania willdenowi TaxID=441366 RepID=UPI001054BABF|nr:retinoblastoma-like protein 1 [Gouania willdenowi]
MFSSMCMKYSQVLCGPQVYMLMDKRLRELSAALNIQDELQLKIWTCFEHSLVKCTFLMVDRHLDQLLLCAICRMAKITGNEILFEHIMDRYKSLEHTSETVLENVLISDGVMGSFLSANDNEDLSPGLPTPNTPSAHYPKRSQEERGNLILFYNRVYTTNMESYVVQFDPTSGGETPPLSVGPKVWRATRGQQRICNKYALFTSPLNAESSTQRPGRLTYYFNKSSPKDLQDINNMVRSGSSRRRQHHVMSLNMEDEESQGDEGPPAKTAHRSVGGALERRLWDVVSDRANVRNQNQNLKS